MILVDSSVWIQFFKGHEKAAYLRTMIGEDTVLLHTLVYAELVLGGLSVENEDLLQALHRPGTPDVDAVLSFIGNTSLVGRGVGYVDAALIYTATTYPALIATLDGALQDCARQLGVLHSPGS